MKARYAKNIISGMSAIVMVVSTMPSIPANAYGNIITEKRYNNMLNEANSSDIIEKTVSLYTKESNTMLVRVE